MGEMSDPNAILTPADSAAWKDRRCSSAAASARTTKSGASCFCAAQAFSYSVVARLGDSWLMLRVGTYQVPLLTKSVMQSSSVM